MGRKSFLIINHISWSNSLISTFTWPVEYEKQEHHCKSPSFTYWCTSHGVKYSLFFGKILSESNKLKDCNIYYIGNIQESNVSKWLGISLFDFAIFYHFKVIFTPKAVNILPPDLYKGLLAMVFLLFVVYRSCKYRN